MQGLLKINVAEGIADTFGAGEFMGRCNIDIAKFASQPNRPEESWCAASSMRPVTTCVL